MITNTGLNSASLILPARSAGALNGTSSIRGHFDQVLSRIQAQPLRVLPRTSLGGGADSLAQQMQREGII